MKVLAGFGVMQCYAEWLFPCPRIVLVAGATPQQPKWACDWSTRFLRCQNSR